MDDEFYENHAWLINLAELPENRCLPRTQFIARCLVLDLLLANFLVISIREPNF